MTNKGLDPEQYADLVARLKHVRAELGEIVDMTYHRTYGVAVGDQLSRIVDKLDAWRNVTLEDAQLRTRGRLE